MKRRGATVDGTKLKAHWLKGYTASIPRQAPLGGVTIIHVRFSRRGSTWIAYERAPFWPLIARGKTLAEAVRNTKAALA